MDVRESSFSTNGSNDQMIPVDVERNALHGEKFNKQVLVRIWKVPVPLRRGYVVSDLFKHIACLTALLCIAEFIYIRRLRAGLVRVPNDPFDMRFGENVNHNSPAIWDDVRQSFIHNAFPVPVHSHNDYWRRIPLFEALGSGCISVEADVHLRGSDLLVGHTSSGLNDDLTLRSMYLEPLQRMVKAQNDHTTDGSMRGIFDKAPGQTVVLLIDHKTAGQETFAELDKQLEPLRALNYLTYWNGTGRVLRPLTIVATGNAPFESVTSLNATHRDIFWDAPLDKLASVNDDFSMEPPIYTYNQSNSYFASTRWHLARLFDYHDNSLPLPSTLSEKDAAASQIKQAKTRGLISRYWDLPSSPPNLVDIVWRVLVDVEVGVINMDNLGATRERARGWGKIDL